MHKSSAEGAAESLPMSYNLTDMNHRPHCKILIRDVHTFMEKFLTTSNRNQVSNSYVVADSNHAR